jgi:hypothetical protein
MMPVSGRTVADEVLRRRPSLKVLFKTGYTRNAVVHNGVLEPRVELIGGRYNVKQLPWKCEQDWTVNLTAGRISPYRS